MRDTDDLQTTITLSPVNRQGQVQAAQGGSAAADFDSLHGSENIQGEQVLTASAPIAQMPTSSQTPS